MASKRQTVIDDINKAFPTLKLRTTEEFNGQTGGIWVAGTEDDIEASDGFNLFNYYNQDIKEVRYVFGIHKEVRKILDKHEWYAEWHDAGTVMLYEA